MKNQPKISEAFKKIVDKTEDLPDKNSIRKMWQELDKKTEMTPKSENKKNKLEKLATSTSLKINKNENKNKNNNNKTQTITNKNKTMKMYQL